MPPFGGAGRGQWGRAGWQGSGQDRGRRELLRDVAAGGEGGGREGRRQGDER